jgi:hypothetical protein
MAGNSFLMQRFINLNYTFFFQTGNLAMESLLSLTSLRAGEWFKEELRTLGALDHIVDTGIRWHSSSLIIASILKK